MPVHVINNQAAKPAKKHSRTGQNATNSIEQQQKNRYLWTKKDSYTMELDEEEATVVWKMPTETVITITNHDETTIAEFRRIKWHSKWKNKMPSTKAEQANQPREAISAWKP